MKTHYTLAALSRPAILVMLGLLPLASLGCATTPSAPSLTITSIGQNKAQTLEFSQAWTSRNSNGDVDVVLVDEAMEKALNGSPKTAPVRQVMHIRVLWCPTRDTKAVVSNAAVKWYVIGCSNPRDVLEYTGSAFVYLDQGEDTTTLKIRNAVVSPGNKCCNLNDPVGASRLEGTFEARQNTDTVNKILKNLKIAQAMAAAPSVLPKMAKTE